MESVHSKDESWNTRLFSEPRGFTCKECGEPGLTLDVNAVCDSCGAITEVSVDEKRYP